MKIKYIGWFIPVLMILGGAISCKNNPPPVENVQDPSAGSTGSDNDSPDKVSLDALDAAIDRAAKARQLAIGFNSAAAFPSEWEAAEAQYNQAGDRLNTTTVKEVRESTARYTAVTAAYEALTEKSVAIYVGVVEAEVAAARAAAVGAGAETLLPEYLQSADDLAGEASSQYQARDYVAARDSAFIARDLYNALKTGAEAAKVRQEIEARDFVRYDPQNVQAADELTRAYLVDHQSKNAAAAQDKADEALLRYNLALRTAREAFASEKGVVAAAERQKALDLKANVAVRQDYEAATSIYNRAAASFRAENFEAAAELYDESLSMYEVISQVAREKRQVAEDALRLAEEKMMESDSTAKNAELILEGGAQ